jgi:YopX protein
MIQPIRYRGKTVDTNQWVFGFYVEHDGQAYIIAEGVQDAIPVKSETVGQLIGIGDRDDQPVYTGDIVNTYPWGDDEKEKAKKAVILWSALAGSPGFFCFYDFKRDSNPIDDESYEIIGYISMPYIEVIGNVFDNPYMLQEIRAQ